MPIPKLNPKFKKKWVEALRSGKYKQGNSNLYNPQSNTYCCLGVACKVLKAKDVDIAHRDFPNKDYLNKMFDTSESNVLSQDLVLESVSWKNVPLINKLVCFNDDKNWSFNQIANYIERYL